MKLNKMIKHVLISLILMVTIQLTVSNTLQANKLTKDPVWPPTKILAVDPVWPPSSVVVASDPVWPAPKRLASDPVWPPLKIAASDPVWPLTKTSPYENA